MQGEVYVEHNIVVFKIWEVEICEILVCVNNTLASHDFLGRMIHDCVCELFSKKLVKIILKGTSRMPFANFYFQKCSQFL